MEEETKQSLLKMIGEDPSFLGIIIGLLFILYLVAQFSNPIIDFLQKLGFWKGSNAGSADAYRLKLIEAVSAGTISAPDATKLAYALAGERFENAPRPSHDLPQGQEPANEFIREFVELATSKDKRARKAAALDAQGKTEQALAVLETLAEGDAQLACARWKSRGAMAYNQFTAKAIESYERAVGCDPDDAEAHNQLGHLYKRTGDLARARAAYEKVLSLGNVSADKTLIAVAYGNLGLIEWTRGNLDAAEAYHQKSLAIEEELGRKEGMAYQHGNLGLIEKTRGNLDAAEAYLKKSLAIDEELGRKEGVAATYGNLGLIERRRGNLDAAEAYLKKSLAIEEALGRKEGMAAAYGNLGLIEKTRGNLDAAEAYHNKSLALSEELGRKEGMAATYGNLGLIEKTRGNLDAAEAYFKDGLKIDEEVGRKEGVAAKYDNLGAVEELRGNLKGALDYWRRSLALYQQIGMPHMIEKIQGWIDEAQAQKE